MLNAPAQLSFCDVSLLCRGERRAHHAKCEIVASAGKLPERCQEIAEVFIPTSRPHVQEIRARGNHLWSKSQTLVEFRREVRHSYALFRQVRVMFKQILLRVLRNAN